ncbi:MAG: response regulator [Anaerolineae bacterium]|nr:response regulator [Anaerolineae bacterium]
MQNRIVFQMSLIRHGAAVDFERWGQGTMLHMNNLSRIDLIILDLMLADGISGFDIYDQIRAVPKYDHVPIVAVSAMDPAIAMPKVRAKGFAGFIAKPIDNHQFPNQLFAVFKGEQVWYAGDRHLS